MDFNLWVAYQQPACNPYAWYKNVSMEEDATEAARDEFPFVESESVLGTILKVFPVRGDKICAKYGDFETAFRWAALTWTEDGEVEVCGTPLQGIAHALG